MDYFLTVEDIKMELEEEVEIPVPLWMLVENGEEDPLALTSVKIEEFCGSEELHFSQDLKPGVEPKVEDGLKSPSTVLYDCPMTSEEGIHSKKLDIPAQGIVLEPGAKVKEEQTYCSYTSEIKLKWEARKEKLDILVQGIIRELAAEVKEEKPFCAYASKIKSELEAKTEKLGIPTQGIIQELVAEVKEEKPSFAYASKIKSELEAKTEYIGGEQYIDLAERKISSASSTASIQQCHHRLEVCKIRSKEVKPNSIIGGCINTSDETSSVFKEITCKCKICNCVFVCEKLYKRQLLKQADNSLCGDHCDFKPLSTNTHIGHMRKHTADKPVRCNVCQYICCKCSDLRKRMRITGDIPITVDVPITSNLCQYKSSTSRSLKCDTRKHTSDKTFRCNICQYICCRCNDKKRKSILTGDKTFSCQLCQYKSSTRVSLARHMRAHKPVKPSVCKLYQYKCSESGDLKKHMITGVNKDFRCYLCRSEFTTAYGLKTHCASIKHRENLEKCSF